MVIASNATNYLTFHVLNSITAKRTLFSQSKEITDGTNHTTDVIEEYCSDEEYRYPPQMSLSPIPGQPPRRMVTKEKHRKEKQNKRESGNTADKAGVCFALLLVTGCFSSCQLHPKNDFIMRWWW